jgi:hypothetical protein
MPSNEPIKPQTEKNEIDLTDASLPAARNLQASEFNLQAKEFLSRVIAAKRSGEFRPNWTTWRVSHPEIPEAEFLGQTSHTVVEHTSVNGVYDGVPFSAALRRQYGQDEGGFGSHSSFSGKFTVYFSMNGQSMDDSKGRPFSQIQDLCTVYFDLPLDAKNPAACPPEQLEDFKNLLECGYDFGWTRHVQKNSQRSFPAGDSKTAEHAFIGTYGDTEVTVYRIARCSDYTPDSSLEFQADYTVFFRRKGAPEFEVTVDSSERAKLIYEQVSKTAPRA